jgi:hypothetical protein
LLSFERIGLEKIMRIKIEPLVLCLFLFLMGCLSAETFRLEVTENQVIKKMGNTALWIPLATSDAFPFGFGPTYAFDGDSSFIAFIGASDDTFKLFVMNDKIDMPISGIGEGCIDGRTNLEWSPDGIFLLFTRGERIWMYNTEVDSAWKVSEPEEDWMEDYDPSFSDDGSRIFFFRGSRFEYVFSGGKYSINLDGTDLRKEEEEIPMYPPEDLRGEE